MIIKRWATLCDEMQSLSFASALSWKAIARSLSFIASQICSVVAMSVTSGIRNLRDCLLASRAVIANFSETLPILRDAAHGTMRSTPASVNNSIASLARSLFGSACTTVIVVGSTSWYPLAMTSTCIDFFIIAKALTWLQAPLPSASINNSPADIRKTRIACWASSFSNS